MMRWISLLLFVAFFSCKNKNGAPDVSDVKMNVTVLRFEKDFFSMDTTQLQASLQGVEKKYPAFLPVYFKYFAPVRDIAQQQHLTFETALLQYYRGIKPLAVEADKKFSNLDNVKNGLDDNLRYVKHYFPLFRPPVVLTSVESLNPENPTEIYGTTYYNDTLVISLQMFLGKDYPAYDPSQYPDYLRRRFEPAYIVPNCIRAVASDIYADSTEGASLIEQMIEKGKQWWLMHKFMPDAPDSLITGYTAQQTTDLQREEGNVWGVITKNENIFSIDQTTIQTYIGEAPFTQTLPQGAPGNIGPWIGWRILNKFEGDHPKMSVQQILHTTAKKIFEEAKYRPK
ncbi:hypothetical protein [Flavisolibacter ginsenosidimutans]|uniref:Gliding motility lipoprotein GldB n=1 Tax=Flavisolibacter ginsenosidimutans TaxID=661481 RepID=A0A5B8UM09_9BACT|nr:hypothetical protein [Flavisolibacter ginsenosidimutans]QEC57382.1 hypothetical protein FSB75_16235 [Flavisolibacter ginsenosidimutans]